LPITTLFIKFDGTYTSTTTGIGIFIGSDFAFSATVSVPVRAFDA
jgi:hypothetical protein